MSETILELSGLKKSFGGNNVVPDLSFSLDSQRVTALIGPNGAGKTTIFNLITGFLTLDAGTVSFRGENIQGSSPEALARKGLVRTFQEMRIFEGISVRDNVLVGAEQGFKSWGQRRRNAEAAMETLELVGLTGKARLVAGELSYAEQKFLSLARALGSGADLLLLDEPTSGLDGRSLDVIMAMIPELSERGKTILIIEHNLDVVRAVADHVIFLEGGRMVAAGPHDELFARTDLSDIYFGGVSK